jgi:hypothetical protein
MFIGCALSVLVLAACSSAVPRATSTPKPGATSSNPTAAASGPPCTKDAIATAAERSNKGAVVTKFACAGAFAYAFVDVPAGGPGGTGISATDLFKASGVQWQAVDRATYCPNHAVPTVIFHNACETA